MFFISDPTLTTDNVVQVIELVNDWDSLSNDIVTSSLLSDIQMNFYTKSKISTECASYYVHCHPESSWTHLASHLYSNGEFAAVEKLKPFLPLRGKYQPTRLSVMLGHIKSTLDYDHGSRSAI